MQDKMVIKVVKKCAHCSFSGRRSLGAFTADVDEGGSPGAPGCFAPVFLDEGSFQSFGGMKFPEEPPLWCPLFKYAYIGVKLDDEVVKRYESYACEHGNIGGCPICYP